MTLVGISTTSTGACPSCGRAVQHTHSFNGLRLVDAYACYRCGPTRYVVAA